MNAMPQTNTDQAKAQSAAMPPLTRDAVLGEMMKLAFANIHDYLDFRSGVPRVDPSRFTRDLAAAITDITITTRQERGKEGNPPAEITTVKINLADKRQALLILGRHVGLFGDAPEPPAAEPDRPDFTDPKARLELARELQFFIDEAKELARAADAKPPA